jgi:hypothetical protein
MTLSAVRSSCRKLGSLGPEEGIPSGLKRFEFRLPRTTSALWVTVGNKGTYFKSEKSPLPRCFIVDLPAGEHRITIFGESRNTARDEQVGLQTALDIWEYAAPKEFGPQWYHSFKFRCGHAASDCTRQELDGWLRFQRGLDRGLHAPCGSVQVRKVATGRQRIEKGSQRFKKLAVTFVFKIYKFDPHQRPGSQCVKKGKR